MHAAAAISSPSGATAPNFTLPSQEDKPVSLSDYKGKWVVLYFYPKDQTTGCTIEAHNFQRDMAKYDALNAVVLGVCLDTVESHKTWCAKDTFSFKLLADPDHKVVDAVRCAREDARRHEDRQPRHLPHLARRQDRQGTGPRSSPTPTATEVLAEISRQQESNHHFSRRKKARALN